VLGAQRIVGKRSSINWQRAGCRPAALGEAMEGLNLLRLARFVRPSPEAYLFPIELQGLADSVKARV
jgi:hypothetical protein